MRSNKQKNDLIVRLMQIGWLRNLAVSGPFVLCPKYALPSRDAEVKQTTKAMKEIAVMLPQAFSDSTCLEIWRIIALYVHVWINCNHGGMNECQEHITHPIGAAPRLEKTRVSEHEPHDS